MSRVSLERDLRVQAEVAQQGAPMSCVSSPQYQNCASDSEPSKYLRPAESPARLTRTLKYPVDLSVDTSDMRLAVWSAANSALSE